MLYLTNPELQLDLLDPVAERHHLGPRFCGGGYVWQVHDRDAGPLLRGPEWPALLPLPFNGQGLPESFRHRTLEGRPLTWSGSRGVALGAGEIAVDDHGGVRLVEPCRWEIEPAPGQLRFRTRHGVDAIRYELTRTIVLRAREIRSLSQLTNLGDTRLALQWFAHPFFAPRPDAPLAALPEGTTLAENPGFTLAGRTLVQKRRFLHRDDGHMDRVQLPPGHPLVATLPHPALSGITFETSFVPVSCVIWGNDRTFSIEPYQTLDLAPGETFDWSLSFGIGAAK